MRSARVFLVVLCVGVCALLSAAPAVALPPDTAEVHTYHFVENGVIRFFMTPLPAEIAALKRGDFRGWEEQPEHFPGWTKPVPGTVAVFRFSTRPHLRVTSHFYAPEGSPDLKALTTGEFSADWQLEGVVFYAKPPEIDAGTDERFCVSGTLPVFRHYNNGEGGAPNHHYTTSYRKRDELRSRYGPEEGIVFCVPDVTDEAWVTYQVPSAEWEYWDKQPCEPTLKVLTLSSGTNSFVCTKGIAAQTVAMRPVDRTAYLGVLASAITVDVDQLRPITPYRHNGIFSKIISDNRSGRLFATRLAPENDLVELDPDSSVRRVIASLGQAGPDYSAAQLVLVGDKIFVLYAEKEGFSGERTAKYPNDWVLAFNRDSGVLLAQIAVHTYAISMAYNAARGVLYVASRGDLANVSSPEIAIVDVRTLQKAGRIQFSWSDVGGMYVDTEQDELWVTTLSQHTVEVYSLRFERWVGTVLGVSGPLRVEATFAPDGRREMLIGYKGGIAVIDGAARQLVRRFEGGEYHLDVATLSLYQ